MNSEMSKLIGTEISIYGVKYLIVGIGTAKILLLQYDEKDESVQYVVGVHPYF